MRRCVRSASAFCFTMSPAITIHVEVLLLMLIVSFFCCCLLCSSPSPSLSSSPRPPPLPRSRGSNGTWILRQLVVRLTCGWLSPWCLSLLRLASRTAASLRDPGREELRRRDERLPRGGAASIQGTLQRWEHWLLTEKRPGRPPEKPPPPKRLFLSVFGYFARPS